MLRRLLCRFFYFLVAAALMRLRAFFFVAQAISFSRPGPRTTLAQPPPKRFFLTYYCFSFDGRTIFLWRRASWPIAERGDDINPSGARQEVELRDRHAARSARVVLRKLVQTRPVLRPERQLAVPLNHALDARHSLDLPVSITASILVRSNLVN